MILIDIVAALGIFAALLLATGKLYKGHLILMFVQPTICIYMILIKEYSIALMNFVYTCTAIIGTFYWKKNEVK